MEVHHHKHPASGETHKGRKWVEHLWEFLMLFLAVTLGFFVENQREHFVEHKREKVFIRSIVEDLQLDITQMDSIIVTRKTMDNQMDSLLQLLNSPGIKDHGNEIYYFSRWLPRTYKFYINDRTISQLKNSGSWRLIRNQKVSEAVAAYDNHVRNLTAYIEQREESLVLILYQSIDKLFNNAVFESMIDGLSFHRPEGNPPLMSYDRMEINEFCNRIHFRKNANLYFLKTAGSILPEAQKTLALIKEEYHLN